MTDKAKKVGNNMNNIRWAPWVAIAITLILSVGTGAFAYGQARDNIEDNSSAIILISEDVEENGDEITDIKILMSELLYINSDISETLKEIQINTEDD